jgi:pimeloyl-ACP methyl ester carboxylesterase
MISRAISNQGTSLCVSPRRGPGNTLVFLHGLTDDSSSFSRVISALGGYYDIVVYDLRGHGKSDAPSNGYEIADHASDLLTILTETEISDATLIGHSLGAEVAMHVARSHPELVSGLVLEDPPWQLNWVGAPNERRQLATASWRKWIQHLQSLSLDEIVQVGLTETPHWNIDDIRAWAAAKLKFRLVALDSVLATRDPFLKIVCELTCPVMLVIGDCRKGAIVTRSMASEAQKLASQLRVVAIEGAGHGIHRDKFELFVNALRDFLRD